MKAVVHIVVAIAIAAFVVAPIETPGYMPLAQAAQAAKASKASAASRKISKGAKSKVRGKKTSPRTARARVKERSGAKRGRVATRQWPSVELFHINRREKMLLRVADDKGRPVRGVAQRAKSFFRCHHTNKSHRMDPRLVRLIYEVGRHYTGKRIEVVSGYRHPQVAKNPRSPHKEGLACDFRVAGVPNSSLRDYLRRTYKQVGVGYYPNSRFVHLDVRTGASAFWIDYSGPGQTSIYAENPEKDLREGRADSFQPTTIDPSWINDEDDVQDDGAGVQQDEADDTQPGQQGDPPQSAQDTQPPRPTRAGGQRLAPQ